MPFIFKAYIVIFMLFTISNLGYWLYMRNSLRIVLYDFFSGLYLVLMMIGYWKLEVSINMTAFNSAIFLLVVGIEFYITTWGDFNSLGIKVPEEISGREIETAKCLSIIVASPAYITSGLLAWDLAVKSVHTWM